MPGTHLGRPPRPRTPRSRGIDHLGTPVGDDDLHLRGERAVAERVDDEASGQAVELRLFAAVDRARLDEGARRDQDGAAGEGRGGDPVQVAGDWMSVAGQESAVVAGVQAAARVNAGAARVAV